MKRNLAARTPHAGQADASPSPAGPCTLDQLPLRRRGRISIVDGAGALRQRLLDMGLLPGEEVEVHRLAPSGDPIWISLRGVQLALRRREARMIKVA